MPRIIKDNWKPTITTYDHFHKMLGHKFKVSYRIIAVIRSHFYEHVPNFSKLNSQDFYKEIVKLRKQFEKQHSRMDEALRPRKIAYAQWVLKDESSLNSTMNRVNVMRSKLADLCDSIERSGLKLASISYLKYIEESPEILRQMLSMTFEEYAKNRRQMENTQSK